MFQLYKMAFSGPPCRTYKMMPGLSVSSLKGFTTSSNLDFPCLQKYYHAHHTAKFCGSWLSQMIASVLLLWENTLLASSDNLCILALGKHSIRICFQGTENPFRGLQGNRLHCFKLICIFMVGVFNEWSLAVEFGGQVLSVPVQSCGFL